MKIREGLFEKIIEWTPAYDKRSEDPNKNYGIGGMTLRFTLKGPNGATQFLVYTNWKLKGNRHPWNKEVKAFIMEPTGADVGYHALSPQYEGQEPISESCEYLDGKPCYYDGSSLMAVELFDEFIEKGEDVVWNKLKESYEELIGKEDSRNGLA